MEDEFPKKRNIRPVEKSSLPVITLFVLVLLVLAMLYVGYEYISDSPSNADELATVVVDTSAEQINTAEPITDEPVSESEESVPEKSKTEAEKKPEPEKEKESVKAISPSSIGGKEITHLVKSGESFSGIASRYNLKTETLKGLNSDTPELKSGVTKLKIQVKAIHTVGPGDVLRVVASKYGVTKEAIMKANGKTKDFTERGEKLVIPFPNRK